MCLMESDGEFRLTQYIRRWLVVGIVVWLEIVVRQRVFDADAFCWIEGEASVRRPGFRPYSRLFVLVRANALTSPAGQGPAGLHSDKSTGMRGAS